MKYIIIFLLTATVIFSLPIEDLSWGMSREEVTKHYPKIKRISFNKNEEVYRTEAVIEADTALYDLLFFNDSLIQVKISNKYPRQNTSLSENIMDRVEGSYTFNNVEKTYVKKDGRFKQVEEYSGISNDGKTHIVIKVDQVSGKHMNIFIFTDVNFYKK